MANLFLTLCVVASLALTAFGAPANDIAKVGDLPCIGCELLAGVVEVELSQGKTQDTVVQDIKSLCAKLPKPLQVTCRDFIQHDMTKFVDAVSTCKGNLKQACQAVGECQTAVALAQPLECFNCKLLANLIQNLLQHGASKDKIETDALNFCSKLLPPLKDSCTNAVTNDLDVFIKDIQNANGDALTACKAFGKCPNKTL